MNLLEFMTGGATAAAKTPASARAADRLDGDGEDGALFTAAFSEDDVSVDNRRDGSPFALLAADRPAAGRWGVSGPLTDAILAKEGRDDAIAVEGALVGDAARDRPAIFSGAREGLIREGDLESIARAGSQEPARSPAVPGLASDAAELTAAGEPLTRTASPLSEAEGARPEPEDTRAEGGSRSPRIVIEGPDGRARPTADGGAQAAPSAADEPSSPAAQTSSASVTNELQTVAAAADPSIPAEAPAAPVGEAGRDVAPETAGRRDPLRTAAAPATAAGGPVRRTAQGLEAQTDEASGSEPVEAESREAVESRATDRRDVFQRAGDPRGVERAVAAAAPVARPAARVDTIDGEANLSAELVEGSTEADALSVAETRAGAEPSAPSAGAELARGQAVRIAPEARAAMERTLGSIERGEDGVIEIALDPPELGKLKISYEMTADGLTARVSAQDPGSLELLRRHADTLLNDLRDLGFENVDLAFSGGEGRGDDAPGEERSRSGPNGDIAIRPEITRERSAITVDGLDIRI